MVLFFCPPLCTIGRHNWELRKCLSLWYHYSYLCLGTFICLLLFLVISPILSPKSLSDSTVSSSPLDNHIISLPFVLIASRYHFCFRPLICRNCFIPLTTSLNCCHFFHFYSCHLHDHVRALGIYLVHTSKYVNMLLSPNMQSIFVHAS